MSNGGGVKEGMEKLGRRLRLGASIFVVFVVAASAFYTWLTLNFSYSQGTRAGLLQKFNREQGWVCKTAEGELALYVVGGLAPQIWHFSVRDERIADKLEHAVGQKVQLHYSEHRGVPSSCFGETGFFVDGVTQVNDSPLPGS
jgi:hypothetical protein